MKKIVVVTTLLMFALTLSAKNISDDKAQQNVDKIITQEISSLNNGNTLLLQYYADLPHLSTWENVSKRETMMLSEEIIKGFEEIIKEVKQKYPDKDFSNISISQKTFTKDNMFLNYIVLDDIAKTGAEISEILKKLNTSVCYTDNYSYDENSKHYQSSKTGKYFCENNKNYLELLKTSENLSKIGGEIYKYSYEYEKNNFIKQNKLDISEIYPLVETLLNYMNIVPNKNLVYHLENIKALQNTKDGVLVKGSEIYSGDIHPDKVAIIYTKKKFVTNENMYPYGIVKFVGTYDYVSALGVGQTVYAYKFVDVNKLINNLYFYPEFKKMDSLGDTQFLMPDSCVEIKIDGKKVSIEEFIKYMKKVKK